MSRSGITLIFCLFALTGFGQYAQNTLALTVSGSDRTAVVKSSVRLAEWHEKTFWPIYDEYVEDAVAVQSVTNRSLRDLVTAGKDLDDMEGFEHAQKIITSRRSELDLRRKYYGEVGRVLNGVVALQFLQTEAMMDMIESASVYEHSKYRKFKLHPRFLEGVETQARHNTIASALSIPAEKEEAFWEVYQQYEYECDALLGEDYSLYALFASDPADFTPALAKRLGHDLLHVMERENNLKEKYFLEMNQAVGGTLAAKFYAWEDYYSLVSKMHAWADAP